MKILQHIFGRAKSMAFTNQQISLIIISLDITFIFSYTIFPEIVWYFH